MKAISKSHKVYNGSLFSEYELIGQSNLLLNYKKQKLISGVRENLNGKLTNLQIQISKLLGYKYVAYEHAHTTENSRNMLNRHLSWGLFIKIIVKKSSKKFFRGLKHILSFV